MRVVAQSAGPVGRFVRTMLAGLLLVLLADPAAAQTAAQATTARDLIHNLVAQRTHPPDASLTPDELAAIARRGDQLANEIGKGIAIAVATAPVGGSAAGFSYGVNPTTGELTLRTASFGPILMDRPLTNGAGVFGFGVSYQRLSFDRFLGQDLRTQGTLLFDNRVTFASDGFEQYITEYMALEPTVDSVTTVLSYGVTSRLDIGAIIPINHIQISGRRQWDYDISRSFPVSPADQAFFGTPTGTDFVQDEGSIDATGVGDITVRTKFAFTDQGADGVGLLFDLRLPTGDEENLLGTGKASGKIGLLTAKSIAEHGNFYASGGYSFGGLSDEVNYAIGGDVQLLPSQQLTVSFELVGQNIRDAIESDDPVAYGPLTINDPRFTPPAVTRLTNTEPIFRETSINVMRAALGAKILLGERVLLSGGVTMPVGDDGLRAGVSPYIGLDFSWATAR